MGHIYICSLTHLVYASNSLLGETLLVQISKFASVETSKANMEIIKLLMAHPCSVTHLLSSFNFFIQSITQQTMAELLLFPKIKGKLEFLSFEEVTSKKENDLINGQLSIPA